MSTLLSGPGSRMSSIALDSTPATPLAVLGTRLSDYLVLIKPRIAVMVLAVVAVGYALGCRGEFDGVRLLSALVGVGCIASGCSVLNQWLERRTDGLMRRTAERPLPAGRVAPTEALGLGVLLAVFGAAWLVLFVNVLTAVLTLATLVAYVGVYTPLKRRTPLCTAIGAIPGAMPPVLGWTAAGGSLDLAALTLFGILFLWQFPHFFAIAWIYAEEYERAGLRMLPHAGAARAVGSLAVAYATILIPVSLLAQQLGLAGDLYFWAACSLGGAYLIASTVFARDPSRSAARRLLLTSLVYLPTLLGCLTFDHWRLLH